MIFKKIVHKYKKMSMPVKAAFWYTVCNFLNKGFALLSTPIFTRIMTEEEYGTFSIFQSWFNILIIFTSLNIFMSSFTKGLLLYKDDQDAFTSSQLSLTTFITLIVLFVYVLQMDFWSSLMDLSPILVLAMFVELLIMPALEFWLSKERFFYRYRNVVFVSIFMNLFCLIVSALSVILLNHKIEARIFSDVFAKFLFAGTLFVFIFCKGKKVFSKKYWKYALTFNVPLIPHYLSNYILNQSDRLMIGKMVGKVQAAFYSVSYTISTVMVLLVTAINNSLTPYIYQSIEKGEEKNIKRAITPVVLLMFVLTVLIMSFAPEIISVFAGNNYLDAIYVIPPVTVSVYFIFIYSMFSTIEYYYQKTGAIAVATTFSAILNLVLNYFGIKLFGYYAAGYTTLICYICLSFFHYYFYKKIIKKEMPHIKNVYDVKLMVFMGILLFLYMILLSFIYSNFYVRYFIIFVIILVLYLKRKFLIHLVRELRTRKE